MKPITPIKPPALRPGDRIGVVSPSGRVRRADLEPGIRALKSAGYDVRLSPHVDARNGYLAGSDAQRLADLHAMISDPGIRAVFCARGGYGSMRLLDRVDYDLFREHPKIMVGYSDVTALLLALHHRTGLITFHGPMIRDLSPGRKDPENLAHLLRLLSSGRPVEIPLEGGSRIVPGNARGRLVGGNLSLVCHLIGTPFLPSFQGRILFLEETGEAVYRVDRMLTHLKLSGRLAGLAGLVMGDFQGCGDPETLHRSFLDVLGDSGFPVVTGLPAGHGFRNLSLPVGAGARLEDDRMVLAIAEGGVRPEA